MLKHLINIFRVNIPLKIISVAIAFLLWLVVVNVSNPEVTDSVTMEIAVNNGEELMNKGKAFTLDSRTVRVTYRVRTNYRSQIQPSSFDAYVDMTDYSITGAVPVYVEVSPSISNLISGMTQNPMVIHVSTEDLQEKDFSVSARVNGQPAEGFIAGDVQMEPDVVSLYGPESEIGKVSRVGIVLDIDGASETQYGTGKIQFFDANDNVIPLSQNITLSSDVQYTVPVYKTKSLSINVPTTGQPERGFTLTGVETEPRFIQVYGDDTLLEQYNTIYLPDGLLDISGVNSNVTISVAMQNYLPEGLYMVSQSDVSVVARIARQTDVIPGAAGLPQPTIQTPPATNPTAAETTAAAPEETTAEHPESETEYETEESTEHTIHESPEPVTEEEPSSHAVYGGPEISTEPAEITPEDPGSETPHPSEQPSPEPGHPEPDADDPGSSPGPSPGDDTYHVVSPAG